MELGIVMEDIPVAHNIRLPIVVMELGIVMEVRFEQASNILLPVIVSPGVNVTEDRPVQSINASSPIDVTELGIVMEVKLVQPLNICEPIVVSPGVNVTEVRPVQ